MASQRSIADLCNQTQHSLVATYLPLINEKLAGHFIRSQDTKGNSIKVDMHLFTHVVPYFAPFASPYAYDFVQGLQNAVDSIRSSNHVDCYNPETTQPHFIIVPICSEGGSISMLKHIMTYINTVIKKDYIGQGKSKRRRILLVTVGMGLVASAAFVLFMAGDIVCATENSEYLCHQPSELIAAQSVCQDADENETHYTKIGYDASERRTQRLNDINQFVYGTLEHEFFQRLASKRGQGHLLDWSDTRLTNKVHRNDALKNWRKTWYSSQNKSDSMQDICNQFAQHCRGNRHRASEYDFKQSVFEYVVNTLADDPENQVIDACWLGFAPDRTKLCELHDIFLGTRSRAG